jgi:RND family efflux transporter MFP subunit
MDMRTKEPPRAPAALQADIRSKITARPVLYGILAVIAVAAALWWYLGRAQAVTTATVTRGTAAEIVYATGAVEPVRWSKVTPLVKARIVERCRCEGKQVKAGDILAKLDDREAQATLNELKAREGFARREVERQTELMARSVTTAQAFERAQSELRSIQALIAAQTERLEYYRLVAPMDGVVLREDGEVGEIVDSTNVLYRIGLPKPLWLVAEVSEEDIPRVRVGMKVLMRTEAFTDQPLTGTVSDITPAGDPVAKTYRVRVALPDDTPLRVGMSVEANIITREKADVLLVPTAALIAGQVFVVEGSRAYRRKVEIGLRGTRSTEIASGLKQGDVVVASVPSGLKDGARVSPIASTGK